MTTEVINGVPRELLEQVAIELEHDTDRYMLGRELRKLLAEQPQAGAGRELSVVPDGYVIVPVEPTHEMAMAAKRELYKSPAWHCRYTAAVRAAISAAPQPPSRRGQGDEVRRLREALQNTRDTIDSQLELIAKRAPGNWLDKIPVVRSLKAHRARCDAALTHSQQGEAE